MNPRTAMKNVAPATLAVTLAVVAMMLGVESSRLRLPSSRASIPETKEDPAARANYELMRLRDPATGRIPDDMRMKELQFARTLPRREAVMKGEWASGASAISWAQRGPVNVGGRTRALAVDIANPGTLLAGGVSGGMWKSTDGGTTWKKVTTPSQLHSVTSIAQDTRPGKRNVWYYGTGELTGNSANGDGGAIYRGDGIFKSTDNGESWAQLPSTVAGTPQVFSSMFQYVWDIVLNPASSADEVYAATIGGVNRSTDGGTTWTAVLGGTATTNSRYTDIAITPAGILYATLSDARLDGSSGAVSQGVWRSINGTQWVDIRPVSPPWPTVNKRIVIGIAPSNERILYFLGETPGFGHSAGSGADQEYDSFWRYVYVSGDGRGAGGSWEDRSSNLPGFGPPVGDFLSQGSYNLVVRVSPSNDSLVFIGGTNIYRSTNGFRNSGTTSWIGGYATSNDISQYDSHHVDQHALVFAPNNPFKLFSGTDGGVFVTTDCTAPSVGWVSLNNAYLTTQFYTVAIDHATSGNGVIIGGMQDNGSWFSGGSPTWISLFSGDGAFCAVADNRSSYYISAQEGLTFRLLLQADGSLVNYARVDPTGGANYLFINPYALDPTNNSVMYMAAGSDLWRNSNLLAIPLRSVSASADNTTLVNWTRMSGSSVSNGVISAVGVSKSSPASRLYYGTSGGSVLRLENASGAAAATAPLDVSQNRGLPSGYVSCIAVDPRNGDRALLVFSNYSVRSIFYTANAGASWSDVSGNLEQNPDGSGNGPSVRWAAIQTYGGGATYFVGTSTGLYSTSSLQGSTTVWVQEGGQDIGNVVVDMIDVRPTDGTVVVATHGQGVFSGSAPSIPPPPEEIPVVSRLEQNFPNPFNPSTSIRIALDQPAFVTLKIFSLKGEEIATILSENRPAGVQPDLVWYPRNLASGVYIYEVRAGSFRQAKKMVYVK
jgi:hypothetical protein